MEYVWSECVEMYACVSLPDLTQFTEVLLRSPPLEHCSLALAALAPIRIRALSRVSRTDKRVIMRKSLQTARRARSRWLAQAESGNALARHEGASAPNPWTRRSQW